MPRPCCQRRIGFAPDATYFKPAGVPLRALEEVVLSLDELEALRLADLNGMYHEQAAEQMKVSRATFGRILEEARRKVTEALTAGKALRIEGGPVLTKGDTNMPNKDGTGPSRGGRGMGRGLCGCGQRRGKCHGGGRGQRGQNTGNNQPLTPKEQ
jgi:predicted DNA-binding protein (UPF0251 family)